MLVLALAFVLTVAAVVARRVRPVQSRFDEMVRTLDER